MKNSIYLFLLVSITTLGQKSINSYKYIIVPDKMDFFNAPDKYKTSSLTKFLFNKHGFTAFLSNEKFPKDLAENRCLALTAALTNKSSMFTTKNTIELQDCYGTTVFKTQQGTSKSKAYQKAYHEAIRNAFTSIKGLRYKYTPVAAVKNSVNKETEVIKTKASKVIQLKAKPVENGFQLVNTKSEIFFEILATSTKNIFILKNKNGVLYKNKENWIVEFYTKNVKKTVVCQINF